MPSDTNTMTPHKFWLRALTGGLLSQFDWLASVLVVNPKLSVDRDKRK